VAAPPYDVLTVEEARASARDRPWSFLRVSRAEIEFPPATDPHDARVYARAGENFRRMLAAGVLRRDAKPCYYVYRLARGGRAQTGVAVAAAVEAYAAGRIRRHELTRPDKVQDRARQVEAVGAHTGPVFAVHRANAEVSAVIRRVAGKPPATDLTAEDGVRHTLWVVSAAADISRLGRAFEDTAALYVADGHHRADAARQVAERRRRADPNPGSGASDSFLVVSFPADEVRILDYNRVVRGLNGLGPGALLERVAESFAVAPSADPVRPRRPHQFGMYLAGRWHRLDLRDAPPAGGDPLTRLDVSLLAERILKPILGVGDPRTDPRLDFVGGARGLEALAAAVDGGEADVAFSLHPTGIEDLMEAADRGAVMPPKSTWFEPKLADGLVSLALD
jgi:uncharacterized protein (DUF1015 family)